ncbi:MAG TPA: PaaI family thioesterase [Solirubrobacteraceae bacterium]|nr:PaaI family thioesterase [Solirubrobacteraceae bacterium]
MPVEVDEIASHHPHCIGCGSENPGSIGLRFLADGDRIHATCTFDERHQGAPGFVHGGSLATAIDDTVGTLLVLLRRPAVTAHLEIDYRAPAFLGREMALEAWADRIEGRKLHLAATIHDGDTLVAEGQALFLEVPLEHFAKGGWIPDEWPY